MNSYSIMVYDTLTGSFLDRIFITAADMDNAKTLADDIIADKEYKNHNCIGYIVIS